MSKPSLTDRLWKAMEAQEEGNELVVFPALFLGGLRTALDAGLSCEQIVSFLILSSGLYAAIDRFDGQELVNRAAEIAHVIKGQRDIEHFRGGR